jgi:hypothetical protein
MARNVLVWSFGEHEQITIPSSFFSRIMRIVSCWEASEHANIWTCEATTSPCFAISSRTFSVST